MIMRKGPTIDAERFAPTPRDPILVSRFTVVGSNRLNFKTYDLLRNLTDDIFSNQKSITKGEEFCTSPLMGIGKVGPPFLY